jgi:hypothetical protein
MTIDKSGKFWKGQTRPTSTSWSPPSVPADTPSSGWFTADVQDCGGTTFALRVDDEEGYADRRCVACRRVVHMLDRAEYVDDAHPEECACPCGGEEFELAVGFGMVDVANAEGSRVGREVKWVGIGARCGRRHAWGVCGLED